MGHRAALPERGEGGHQMVDIGIAMQGAFCGCRLRCKRSLTLCARDRSAVFCKAFLCGVSGAAGRYGDLRAGSKSGVRVSMLIASCWFFRSRSIRSFRPFGSQPFSHRLHRRQVVLRCTSIMQARPAPELDNPHSLSAWPRSRVPSCWQGRPPPAGAASWPSFARAMILEQSICAPSS